MKIADQRMFRKFDSFKEEVFHRKSQNKKNVPNPISVKFRWVMPLGLIFGGLWLVYKNTPTIKDYFLQKEIITYQQKIGYEALRQHWMCRWEEFWIGNKGKNNVKLANQLYLTKLQSDFLYMKERREQKYLDFQLKTKFTFWLFNFGNQQNIKLINQYGDLVTRKSQSKLMLGNSARIWKRKEDTVVKRQKIFDFYLKEKGKIGNQCQKVNLFNKITVPPPYYDSIIDECQEKTKKVADKIEDFIDKRLKEQKKRKIRTKQNS